MNRRPAPRLAHGFHSLFHSDRLSTGRGRSEEPGPANRRSTSTWTTRGAATLFTCSLLSLPATAGESPLRFEPRPEGAEPAARFLARGARYQVMVDKTGVAVALGPEDGAGELDVVRIGFHGGSSAARLEGQELLASRSHYLLGSDESRWIRNVPHYRSVRAASVYPGIDLVFNGRSGELEIEIVAAPGADLDRIAMNVEGRYPLLLDASGELRARVRFGELRLSRPRVFELRRDERREIAAVYVLAGADRFGFRLAEHDRERAHVIDPVLSYSTYVGGALEDSGRAIAVDAEGSAYVTGRALSLDFPTEKPFAPVRLGSYDAFVLKLSPDGSELVYSTFLGGSGPDRGRGVAVDDGGFVYVSGETYSPSFPVKNALQSSLAGDADAFLTKLDPTGSALVYSTFLGGQGFDSARGIAVDRGTNAAVMGQTESADFPTRNARQPSIGGSVDAFVAKLDASGSELSFSTYHGGSAADLPFHIGECATVGDPRDAPGWGIAVDASGGVYVAGTTESLNFPVLNPLQSVHAGGLRDAFYSKFSPTGELVFSSLLGGTGGDSARAIAVGEDGTLYLTGATRSDNFPTTSGTLQRTKKGLYDAFVVRIGNSGAQLLSSTFLGGDAADAGSGIAVDALGNVTVIGQTLSQDFPVRSALQAFYAGGTDVFLTKLNRTLSEIFYSTYLGGTNVELPCNWNSGLAIDERGDAYVTGGTNSDDFLTTEGAFQTERAGSYDVFVAKVSAAPSVEIRLTPEGSSNRLTILLANADVRTRPVELKLWVTLESSGAPPSSLVTIPIKLDLPPLDPLVIADTILPATIPFPGTTFGIRLIDPATGTIVSESLCRQSPCNAVP